MLDSMRRWRIGPLFVLAGLTGCGGGLSIGIGDGWGDEPPDVSLVAAVETAGAGDSVRLSAAAVDDWGVDHVTLYRIEDDGTRTSEGSDISAPYAWTVVLPAAASGRVRYLARAVDGLGQATDSNSIEITLR